MRHEIAAILNRLKPGERYDVPKYQMLEVRQRSIFGGESPVSKGLTMLVLSRKKNEDIFCFLPDGSQIRFVVVDIRGDKVRLGVEAPEAIPVHRGEIAAKVGGATLEQGTVNLPKTNLHGLPCRVVSRQDNKIVLSVQLADKLHQYELPQEAFSPNPPRDNAPKKEV